MLALLALCCVIFMAIQSALTYVVPFLDDVTGVSGPLVSVFLLGYGVATSVGSYAGGRFADTNARGALIVGTIGVTASLIAWTLFGGTRDRRRNLGVRHGPVRDGHGAVAAAPGRQPRGARRTACRIAAGVSGQRRNRRSARSPAASQSMPPGHPGLVTTGAVIAAIAIGVAWATSLLKPAIQPSTQREGARS